jgi:hypothetical protein
MVQSPSFDGKVCVYGDVPSDERDETCRRRRRLDPQLVSFELFLQEGQDSEPRDDQRVRRAPLGRSAGDLFESVRQKHVEQ